MAKRPMDMTRRGENTLQQAEALRQGRGDPSIGSGQRLAPKGQASARNATSFLRKLVTFRPLALLICFILLLLVALISGSPEISLSQTLQTPTPMTRPYVAAFVPEVTIAPRNDHSLPQNVRGGVVDQFGRGIGGVTVQVRTDGWEGYTTTDGSGGFTLNLTKGHFTVSLGGLDSVPARISVDGTTDIQILYRAYLYAPPTPIPTATAIPTATVTPTVSPTPRVEASIVITSQTTPTPVITIVENRGSQDERRAGLDFSKMVTIGAVVGGSLFLVSAFLLLK